MFEAGKDLMLSLALGFFSAVCWYVIGRSKGREQMANEVVDQLLASDSKQINVITHDCVHKGEGDNT